MPNTYVIYYGWLTDDRDGEPNNVAQTIAAARTPLLIAHFRTAPPERHVNISPRVLSLMQSVGTQVYAYVATQTGKADLGKIKKTVTDCLAGGVDGIFFDESDSLASDDNLAYYETLARLVRGKGKGIIVNPGVAQCGEKIMQVADRVMVEHQWRNLATGSLWSFRYPGDRFMGVSSNEGAAMGYVVDEARGIADTREAWERGVGWHTSTTTYIELPPWFSAYARAVQASSVRQSVYNQATPSGE